MEGKEKTMFDKLKLRIMRNWCKSMYVIDGDAKEVRGLYELMKGLQRRKEPFVRNGFGTTWLGCLLNALGHECYYIPEVFEWLGKIFGQPVSSEEQVSGLVAQWVKTSEYAYCYIDRFKVVN